MEFITDNILGGLVVTTIIIVLFIQTFVGWCSAMFCTWLFAPPRANLFKRGRLKRTMIESLIFTTAGPIASILCAMVGGFIFEFLILVGLFFGFWIPTIVLACMINDLDFGQGILYAGSYLFMYAAGFWLVGWLFGASPPEGDETVAILQWIMDNGRYLASYLR